MESHPEGLTVNVNGNRKNDMMHINPLNLAAEVFQYIWT